VVELLARRRAEAHEESGEAESNSSVEPPVTSEAEAAVEAEAPAKSTDMTEHEARALFDQFDANGDGTMDLGEFTAYLTSVFAALAHTPAFQAHGASPAEMAAATASQCFDEADANHDGALSFDEFRNWYLTARPGNDTESHEAEDWAAESAAEEGAAAGAGSLATAQSALAQAAKLSGAPSTHFDAEWWLASSPAARPPASALALVRGAASAAKEALREGCGGALAAALWRELGLALVLQGDAAAAVTAFDESLALEPSGQDAAGTPGFVWGIKSRLLSDETALVCLLRVSGVPPPFEIREAFEALLRDWLG